MSVNMEVKEAMGRLLNTERALWCIRDYIVAAVYASECIIDYANAGLSYASVSPGLDAITKALDDFSQFQHHVGVAFDSCLQIQESSNLTDGQLTSSTTLDLSPRIIAPPSIPTPDAPSDYTDNTSTPRRLRKRDKVRQFFQSFSCTQNMSCLDTNQSQRTAPPPILPPDTLSTSTPRRLRKRDKVRQFFLGAKSRKDSFCVEI